MDKKINPKWWLLYLTAPLMIGLLVLEGGLAAPPVVHRIMEFGIVIVSFGLMAGWVHANEAALTNAEFEKERWRLEPDIEAEVNFDPHRLPLADAGEDLSPDWYSPEARPTQGRFN